MTMINNIYIKCLCDKIAEDTLGNKYYESKYARDYLGHKKRYVIYSGDQNPLMVSGIYYEWLHYMRDDISVHNLDGVHKVSNCCDRVQAKTDYKSSCNSRLADSYVRWTPE